VIDFRSSSKKRSYAKRRRGQLDKLGLCINAALPENIRDPRGRARDVQVVHGEPARPSKKCKRCIAVHKGSR